MWKNKTSLCPPPDLNRSSAACLHSTTVLFFFSIDFTLYSILLFQQWNNFNIFFRESRTFLSKMFHLSRGLSLKKKAANKKTKPWWWFQTPLTFPSFYLKQPLQRRGFRVVMNQSNLAPSSCAWGCGTTGCSLPLAHGHLRRVNMTKWDTNSFILLQLHMCKTSLYVRLLCLQRKHRTISGFQA